MNVVKLLLYTCLIGFGFSPLFAQEIIINEKNTKHIKFNGIKPSVYHFNGSEFKAVVDKSSSALIYSFDMPIKIKKIRFMWKRLGTIAVKNLEQEASKSGDDNYFRLGLLLHGKKPSLPFFAPSWVKLTAKHLKVPADKIVYYFVDAKHLPNSQWRSPYNSSIVIKSVKSILGKDGYNRVVIDIKNPVNVAGLWIMSDGDNSKSKFTTWVKHLTIE